MSMAFQDIDHPEAETLIIDPSRHRHAMATFLAHFGLVERPPDLPFLQRLLQAFAQLPYENISKILKLNRHFDSPQRLRLPEEVMEEHIHYHFGGTCFSLSYFLHVILSNLGFINYIVMADMGRRRNVHCALIVEMERKKYLVDPGYLLTQAMQLTKERSRLYRSPHSGVQIQFDRVTERFHLYTFDRQVIKLRYTFEDRPCPLPEFLQHWYNSFYQGTMHGICLTRLSENGMIYVHDDFLQIVTFDGKRKEKIKANYQQMVAEIFSIHPSWVEAARAAIAENMAMERIKGIYQPVEK